MSLQSDHDDDVGTSHGISNPDNVDNISFETHHGMSNFAANQFGKSKSGSVSVIINQYKSSVKRWCNKNGYGYFQWQSRFHDHIIMNDQSFQTIADYIVTNPKKWKNDKFYYE